MLRLSEIKLPLDHPQDALKTAILQKLRIQEKDLLTYTLFKRSYDARKKGDISLVYLVDIETTQDTKLLEKFKADPHVRPTPDMSYKTVAKAPENLKVRPS